MFARPMVQVPTMTGLCLTMNEKTLPAGPGRATFSISVELVG
jgi:hypothetical protein